MTAFLLIIWAIAGVILLFSNLEKVMAFADTIPTKWKKILFYVLIVILGGPISFAILFLVVLVVVAFEYFIIPVALWVIRNFKRYILNPVVKWLQS